MLRELFQPYLGIIFIIYYNKYLNFLNHSSKQRHYWYPWFSTQSCFLCYSQHWWCGIFKERAPLWSLYFLPGDWRPFCKFWCWHYIDPTRKYQWKVFDNYKGSYFFLKWFVDCSVNRCHCPVMTPEITIILPYFLVSVSLTVNIQVHEMNQKLIYWVDYVGLVEDYVQWH